MDPAKILEDLGERFRATANVSVVYGESRVVGEKTLIPIAAVSYGLGAGGGSGKSEGGGGKPAGEGEGGGGGGQINVRPIAVLEIDQGQTRMIPVLDVGRVALGAMFAFVIGAFFLRRRR